jgi:NADH:ubiquinone oxidoreductase subunit K
MTYVLLRGLPRSGRNLWIVLAMNAAQLLFVAITDKSNFMRLEVLGIAIISVACSYGGMALAARAAMRHETA